MRRTLYVYVPGASLNVSVPKEILHAEGDAGLFIVLSYVGAPGFRSVFHWHRPLAETPASDVQPSGSELNDADTAMGVGTPCGTVMLSTNAPPFLETCATAMGAAFAKFTGTLHVALRVCVEAVTVTVAVFVPGVLYVFVTVCPVPDNVSVPVHEYVYVPKPPEASADHVTGCPVVPGEGEPEHDTASGGGGLTARTGHETTVVCVPDVIVTEAFFEPTVEYVFTTD